MPVRVCDFWIVLRRSAWRTFVARSQKEERKKAPVLLLCVGANTKPAQPFAPPSSGGVQHLVHKSEKKKRALISLLHLFVMLCGLVATFKRKPLHLFSFFVQADALAAEGIKADSFLLLNVPDEMLIKRVVGRRLDPDTGDIYHLDFNPPPAEIVDRLASYSAFKLKLARNSPLQKQRGRGRRDTCPVAAAA